jgi:hypothetical protein
VEEGKVANVSVFVQHAVRRSLDDVAGWAGVLAQALEGTGGPLTPEEVQWADEVLAGGGERAGGDSAGGERAGGDSAGGERAGGERAGGGRTDDDRGENQPGSGGS